MGPDHTTYGLMLRVVRTDTVRKRKAIPPVGSRPPTCPPASPSALNLLEAAWVSYRFGRTTAPRRHRSSFGDLHVCLFLTVGTTPFPRRRAPNFVCASLPRVPCAIESGVFTVCVPELKACLGSGPAVYLQNYVG
ncbi:unnamed protein product [Macrosiphum euphorbiae]|uniref:Uncharacterized protein n=1 Tax=Macrosiphum euphorbiae TaxID=13131 RepID=A0AAV0WRG9_9HEMI|nr:unnamed protein product [Macrosiphum euphorbiae]